MRVHTHLDDLPIMTKPVLTIGSFDGLHVGHQHIIKSIVDIAKDNGGESVLMTFEPHPRQVVSPNDEEFRLITDLEEKLYLLEGLGLDHVLIMPFTVEFSQIDPYQYVEKILIEKIKVHTIVIGYDHRFGLNRKGNIDLLKAYADQAEFNLIEIPEQEVDHHKVSSTAIRNHLIAGDIAGANLLLGHTYSISGQVEHGMKQAGILGYPTANLRLRNKLKILPLHGTYAADCLLEGTTYEAMLYIGNSRTLQDGSRRSIEVHIFHEFTDEFYGSDITVIPLKHIRKDEKFLKREELISNIQADAREVNFIHQSRKAATDITIAVLNYNGAGLLAKYLPSLTQSSSKYKFEIVVIDNASTDDSIAIIEQLKLSIRIIKNKTNTGFAGGYNEGLKTIGTPYIALINSDVEATANWLDPIIDILDKEKDVAAVQPKILSLKDKTRFEYAGAAGGFLDSLKYPYCRGRILDTVESDIGQYNSSIEVDWTSGAAMVIRSRLFHTLDGFDTDFFAHQEEIDLCWRVRRLGYRLLCLPDAVVYHLGGGTLDYDNPNKLFLNFRNNYWMMMKNTSGWNKIKLIHSRIVLDKLLGFSKLLRGNFKSALALFRGLIAGYWSWHTNAKKYREFAHLKKRYSIHPEKENARTSLLKSYFIRKQKKYSDLT